MPFTHRTTLASVALTTKLPYVHQYGLISQINTTQDLSLDICEHEAKKPHKISPSSRQTVFFFKKKMLQHVSLLQSLSTFVGLFEEIKEKAQLRGAMSVGRPHSRRLPSHCLLFNPRLGLLFNFSFGRYPGFSPPWGRDQG